MAAILNFRQKHKIAYISLTVRDRAISAKFSTPGHLSNIYCQNFKKIFVFRKMVAILNFWIFGKNTKLLISPKRCKIERFRRNFRPQGYLSKILCAKIFCVPKNGGHLNFWQKHKIAYISLTVRGCLTNPWVSHKNTMLFSEKWRPFWIFNKN